jgi:hypothetical protein
MDAVLVQGKVLDAARPGQLILGRELGLESEDVFPNQGKSSHFFATALRAMNGCSLVALLPGDRSMLKMIDAPSTIRLFITDW